MISYVMGVIGCHFGKFISSSRCCSTLDLAHSIEKVQHYAWSLQHLAVCGQVRIHPLTKFGARPKCPHLEGQHSPQHL